MRDNPPSFAFHDPVVYWPVNRQDIRHLLENVGAPCGCARPEHEGVSENKENDEYFASTSGI